MRGSTDHPVGVSTAHTTVPQPTVARFDPAGTRHVIAFDDRGPALRRLVAEVAGAAADHVLIGPEPVGDGPIVHAPTLDAVDIALRDVLATARVGVRVYALGSEALVRRTAAAAAGCGLERDEIQGEVTGSAARRVWCTHCKAITPDVTTQVAVCQGCGRTLEVYHHHSRRHAAYMGFMADAEVPGERPAPEVRWP